MWFPQDIYPPPHYNNTQWSEFTLALHLLNGVVFPAALRFIRRCPRPKRWNIEIELACTNYRKTRVSLLLPFLYPASTSDLTIAIKTSHVFIHLDVFWMFQISYRKLIWLHNFLWWRKSTSYIVNTFMSRNVKPDLILRISDASFHWCFFF